jgi:phosphoribosylamine---glycine ligase
VTGARSVAPQSVLVVGAGAREHALAWRMCIEGVERVTVAPGNPLMTDVAEVRPDVAMTDFDELAALARSQAELVVVGPETPLADGLADRLIEEGVPVLGPTRAAAALEGSKAFCREVAGAAGVAMAAGAAFTDEARAVEYARILDAPLVVKADGLAAGKGVVVCPSLAEAEAAVKEAFSGRFGEAGRRVIVERALHGPEASLIALCDGTDALLLPPARDHKRLLDDDRGPNTGGMGAYSPVPEIDDVMAARLVEKIHLPALAEMRRRGAPFRGFLYAGLMLTADGPRLLEFNARLGDPEAQAILPRLGVPLTPLLAAAARGRLAEVAPALGIAGRLLPVEAGATVALTLATAGYPDAPRSGDSISGVGDARRHDALVFGAGVSTNDAGQPLTAGGRVLTVVGRGDDLADAAAAAYEAADLITFDGRQLRRDIGRALAVAEVVA